MQLALCLVLAMQVVLHVARGGAARRGRGQQVGVGQLQHQPAEQARVVAQALFDALLAEGADQHGLVVLSRVVPGRATGDSRVGGLVVAVQIADIPVGRLDVEDRYVQALERLAITATAGTGGVFGVQTGIGAQVDAELPGDARGVFAQAGQCGIVHAVLAGVGIHHVAGDQAVDVDHRQQVGASRVVQRGHVGPGAAQAFFFRAEADDLQAVLQLQPGEVARHLGQHAGARGVVVQALQGRAAEVGIEVGTDHHVLVAEAGGGSDDVLRGAGAVVPAEALPAERIAAAHAGLHPVGGAGEAGGVAVAARVVVDQLVDGAGSMFAERVGAGQGGAEQAAKTDGASEGFDHFTFLVVGWEEKRQESNSRMRAGNLSAQTD